MARGLGGKGWKRESIHVESVEGVTGPADAIVSCISYHVEGSHRATTGRIVTT